MTNSNVYLGQGHVFHARQIGKNHAFRYPTYFLHFDCAEEKSVKDFFKESFYGLFSISAKDYLSGESNQLKQKASDFIFANCGYRADEIRLQTMPKMLSYAFNPVSFWFCYQKQALNAVLVEVNNTFGERHCYWLYDTGGIVNSQWMRAEKVFHVSPFLPVDGYYLFRFSVNIDFTQIDINHYGPDGELRISTQLTGKLAPLFEQKFICLLLRYGWITPLVVMRIHLQALILFLKQNPFYRKPQRPNKEVSS